MMSFMDSGSNSHSHFATFVDGQIDFYSKPSSYGSYSDIFIDTDGIIKVEVNTWSNGYYSMQPSGLFLMVI